VVDEGVSALLAGAKTNPPACTRLVRDDIVAALKNSGNVEGLAPVAPIVVCVA
jgi:hypothetical protein